MKKMFKGLAVAAIAASILTGCTKKNENEAAAKGDSSSKESVSLELYYYKQENDDGLKAVIKQFESENPGITIKTLIIPNDADASMSARAEQGALPDIIQMQSYSRVFDYAKLGYLVDLSDEDCIKAALPDALSAVTYKGKQYALPTDYAGIGVIYNKDIFEKLNLSIPQTFDELQDVCEVLQENGYVPFSALLKENWSVGHFITMVHTALLSEKNMTAAEFIESMNDGKASYGDVDTKKLFKILDFYRANMNKNASEMGGNEQQQSFAKGESAMMVQGLWSYIDAKKINPDLNAGYFPFPVFNKADQNKFYADVDSTFAISSQSSAEKQAAAKKFLNWLTSKEGQSLWMSEYKLIPPFAGVDAKTFGGPYVDLMESVDVKGANPWAFSQYPQDAFEGACKNGAQGYMMKTTSAEEVINGIDTTWAKSARK